MRRFLTLVAACAALAAATAADAASVEQLRAAAAAYRAQLAANPNQPDVRAALGEILESLGDIAGAQAEYDRAIKGPGDADRALVRQVFEPTVLPGWVRRCGARCGEVYNQVIAPIAGMRVGG